MTYTNLIPFSGSVGRWMTLYETEAGREEKFLALMVYYV